jgi:hypothetical protein
MRKELVVTFCMGLVPHRKAWDCKHVRITRTVGQPRKLTLPLLSVENWQIHKSYLWYGTLIWSWTIYIPPCGLLNPRPSWILQNSLIFLWQLKGKREKITWDLTLEQGGPNLPSSTPTFSFLYITRLQVSMHY